MSDIPPRVAPGWHYDSAGLLRWWDGTQWGPYAPPVGVAPAVAVAREVQGPKELAVAYLMLIFLGTFGAHQFYLNQTLNGVMVIVLWWGGWATAFVGVGVFLIIGVLIWFVVDLCLMPSYVRTANARAVAVVTA